MRGDMPQGYLEFNDIYGQNFNGYTSIFEVRLFNGVADDTTGSRAIPEIAMAVAQTGSNTVSAHRTARNKIPSPTSIFLMSPGRFSDVVGDTTGSRITPEIDMAGSTQTGSYRISICTTAVNKSPSTAHLKVDIQHP